MNGDTPPPTLIDLLDRLAPVPEPLPIPLWPQTTGWIWLAVMLAVGLSWLVRHLYRRHRANAYRRAALRELAAADGTPAAIALVLRRTALAAYPRDAVAGLHGEAWLAFLDEAYGGAGFREGPGRIIAVAPYARSVDAVGAAPLAATWIRRHRPAVGTAP